MEEFKEFQKFTIRYLFSNGKLNSDETLKTLYPSKVDLLELENEATKIVHS